MDQSGFDVETKHWHCFRIRTVKKLKATMQAIRKKHDTSTRERPGKAKDVWAESCDLGADFVKKCAALVLFLEWGMDIDTVANGNPLDNVMPMTDEVHPASSSQADPPPAKRVKVARSTDHATSSSKLQGTSRRDEGEDMDGKTAGGLKHHATSSSKLQGTSRRDEGEDMDGKTAGGLKHHATSSSKLQGTSRHDEGEDMDGKTAGVVEHHATSSSKLQGTSRRDEGEDMDGKTAGVVEHHATSSSKLQGTSRRDEGEDMDEKTAGDAEHHVPSSPKRDDLVLDLGPTSPSENSGANEDHGASGTTCPEREVTTATGTILYTTDKLPDGALKKMMEDEEHARYAVIPLFACAVHWGLAELVEGDLRLVPNAKIDEFLASAKNMLNGDFAMNPNDTSAHCCHRCGTGMYAFAWSNCKSAKAANVYYDSTMMKSNANVAACDGPHERPSVHQDPTSDHAEIVLCAMCNSEAGFADMHLYRFEHANTSHFKDFVLSGAYIPRFEVQFIHPQVFAMDSTWVEKMSGTLEVGSMACGSYHWVSKAVVTAACGGLNELFVDSYKSHQSAHIKLNGGVSTYSQFMKAFVESYLSLTTDIVPYSEEDVSVPDAGKCTLLEGRQVALDTWVMPTTTCEQHKLLAREVKLYLKNVSSGAGAEKTCETVAQTLAPVVHSMHAALSVMFPSSPGFPQVASRACMAFVSASAVGTRPNATTLPHNDITPGPNVLFALRKCDRESGAICSLWLVFLTHRQGAWERINAQITADVKLSKLFTHGFRPVPITEGGEFIRRGSKLYRFSPLTPADLFLLAEKCGEDVHLIG
eukprot:gene28545-31706_t